MTVARRIDCEIRRALPATLAAVEDFFVEFRQLSQARFDHPNRFAAELLVREALTNAVIHGCHADPARQVRCALRLSRRRLLIVIEDDGDGFDWREKWNTTAKLLDCSGRGIRIIRGYADRVRYNHTGNVVMIIKRLG